MLRKFLFIIILTISASLSAAAQSPSSIKLRCPSPYGSIYGNIIVTAGGDINYWPCPTFASVFYRNVDFSNATVTGLPFTVSPLTTKGDLWGYSTLNTRVPVGANGTVLTADSGVATGLSYKTIASLGGVTGTGTTNFVPRWTNGAGGVIGNTPFSWNGSTYAWNNTALNATFTSTLIPSAGGNGRFLVGNGGTAVIDLNELGTLDAYAGTINLGTTAATATTNITANGGINADSRAGIFTAGDVVSTGNGTKLTITDSSQTINIGGNAIAINANTNNGIFKAGDVDLDNSQVLLTVNDGAKNIQANSRDGIFAAGDMDGAFNNTRISLDDSSQQITLNSTRSGLQTDGNNRTTKIGDFLGSGQGTLITVDDNSSIIEANIVSGGIFRAGDIVGADDLITIDGSTNRIEFTTTNFLFSNAAALGVFDLSGVVNYALQRTFTPAGTTGNQTIHKPNGTVNIAGGGSSIVVTNNTVNTSSTIIAVANTNDATCAVKNAVPTANTITITMTAACTGETRVAFWVWN